MNIWTPEMDPGKIKSDFLFLMFFFVHNEGFTLIHHDSYTGEGGLILSTTKIFRFRHQVD